jgi:hypothetical protein
MKINFNLLICFLMLIILNSCNSYKEQSLKNNLENIVTDTEKNYKNYTEQDWEKKDKAFEEILSKDYLPIKDKMSNDKRKEINILIGKYQALKLKSGINNFKNLLKDGYQQLESLIGELSSDSTLLN